VALSGESLKPVPLADCGAATSPAGRHPGENRDLCAQGSWRGRRRYAPAQARAT